MIMITFRAHICEVGRNRRIEVRGKEITRLDRFGMHVCLRVKSAEVMSLETMTSTSNASVTHQDRDYSVHLD